MDIVECPICSTSVPFSRLNHHLDNCLSKADSSSKDSVGRPSTPAAWKNIFHSSNPKGTSSSSTALPNRRKLDGLISTPNKRSRGESAHIDIPVEQIVNTSTVPKILLTTAKDRVDSVRPFADRMRPQTLDEFVGQSQVLNGPLRILLDQGVIPSMILWGPPGSGKTTLARLLTRSLPRTSSSISNVTNPINPLPYRFVELSATSAGIVDVKSIMEDAFSRLQLTGQRTVLFVDEIQRFSRAQQDIFLPALERGYLTLIAATTENPSFRLQGALLSRLRVFVLVKLTVQECFQVLV
jgi:putative ATPase